MNARRRLTRLLVLTALVSSSLAVAHTAAQAPSPRIRGPIEPTPSVILPGSLNPHVRFAEDLGALQPDTIIRGITLVFSRSADQQSALDQLLAEQTTPSSPLFHHWLTPADFAARFGPAPADVAETQTWLQSHGFTIDSTAPDRITFSGTAAQIHQAFAAELHHFRLPANNGNQAELHFAPATDLSLPPALAPVTSAILHLHDFRPRPNVRPRPNYTTRTTQTHYLDPQDIGNMYDIWPIDDTDGLTEGQALAIVGQTFAQTGYGSVIYTFSRYMGGGNITPVLVPGSGVDAIFYGDLGESEIDLEYGSVFAPENNVFFVYTGSSTSYDVFDALDYAITQDIAAIISISYDECEPVMSAAELQQRNATLQQAAAQGQTVVVASGDQGSTACVYYDTSSATTTQQQSLAVNFPASSPYVTAVGGTQMAPATFAAGTNQYWTSATNGDADESLIGYVPEIVWNEDSPTTGIFASGGGASSIFARPSWQTGVPGIPAGSFRLIPDVALQASEANPGYIICSDDPYLTGGQTDCNNSVQLGSDSYLTNGGTSFAAPIFASALMVISANVHAYGLGNINPVLYGLAAQPNIYAAAFHDITLGTTACVSADTDCSPAGQSGFAAGIGYDQATGLGSVDFAKLAAAWPANPPTSLTYTAITFTDNGTLYGGTSASPGSSVSITAGVSDNLQPSGPVPTGAFSVSLDGQPLSASSPITPPVNTTGFANTVYTFTAPPTNGSHVLRFNYPGDATHLSATTTFALMVGSALPTGNVGLSASNLTIAGNGSGSNNITITPTGGYNGMLTWTVALTGGTVETTYCYLINAAPVSGPTTGTMQLGVGTACDSPTSLKSRSSSTVQRSSLDPHRNNPRASHREHRFGSSAAPILALLLFAALPRSRRKPLPFLAVLFLSTLPIALSGCGGGSGSAGAGGGGGGSPQAQVYTVTITAKDSVVSTITASTNFTLTVD